MFKSVYLLGSSKDFYKFKSKLKMKTTKLNCKRKTELQINNNHVVAEHNSELFT